MKDGIEQLSSIIEARILVQFLNNMRYGEQESGCY